MATTIYPQNPGHKRSSIPRLNIDATMASQPPPASSSPKPNNGNNSQQPRGHEQETYRLLSHAEWVQFCRGVGVLKDDESEEVVRPTNRWWPPKGFRDGLYQDVLVEKTKFSYWFHAVGIANWVLMLLQIAMSAVLTALGSVSSSSKEGTAIVGCLLPLGELSFQPPASAVQRLGFRDIDNHQTSIAAVNTCVGGILALMHNSGIPDRYRKDRNEFNKIEEHLKSIIDTALVPADQDINEVLAGCFDLFRDARQTVQDNIPASYTTAPASGKTLVTRASKLVDPKK
ncbi:hypothetical protein GGR54DRAFT_89529 [Hypoxylon sp. NC1633]|nr:hypothetical protein GGR54DRAFT_89529 [Hypoxylon sp. NC1633]